MKKTKPVLYLDCDGVLFGKYDGQIQPRPNFIGFLRWCIIHFECRWLTSFPKDWLHKLFVSCYARDILESITYIHWKRKGSKFGAIDLNEDFYWVEDFLDRKTLLNLRKNELLDRYIHTNDEGPNELYRVQGILETHIQLRSSLYK